MRKTSSIKIIIYFRMDCNIFLIRCTLNYYVILIYYVLHFKLYKVNLLCQFYSLSLVEK
jgi:hypothetical protein